MQLRDGLADLANQMPGLCGVQLPATLDELLQGFAGNVVVDDDELIGHLVRCLDVGRGAHSQSRGALPRRLVGTRCGDTLAHEGARTVQGDKLGYASLPMCENTLHVVGVINAHCMHYLVVVQAFGPVPHDGISAGLHVRTGSFP